MEAQNQVLVGRFGDLTSLDVTDIGQSSPQSTPRRLTFGLGKMTYDEDKSLAYEEVQLMETTWLAAGWCISEHTVRKVRADYQLEVLYTAAALTPGGPNRIFTEDIWKEATHRWKPCAISISPRRLIRPR